MYLSFGGRVGQDAELRTVNTGSTVCNFSVAVSTYNHKARERMTTWVKVAVWGKRGEKLADLVTKGSTVSITGEYSHRVHEGKVYVEVTASDVTLLGSPPREDDEDDEPLPPQRQRQQAQRPAARQTRGAPPPDDDDIPF